VAVHGRWTPWEIKGSAIHQRVRTAADDRLLTYGLFDYGNSGMPAEASISIAAVGYTIQMSAASLRSVQPFLEYSVLDAVRDDIDDFQQAVVGLDWDLGRLWISSDIYLLSSQGRIERQRDEVKA
jgi:hypothetical protein